MNVSIQNIDLVNAIIKVEIAKADYQENVEKSLRRMRQKANIPGFRPGNAPLSMIKKMYESSAVAEELNNILSQQLHGFIKDNGLNVLGEPLPNESNQKKADIAHDETLEFLFDVALAPEISLEFDKKDTLAYYNIAVDEKQVEDQIKSLCGRYGTYEQVEESVATDMVKGLLTELDAIGQPKADGIVVENAVLMPSYLKHEAQQGQFVGQNIGAIITINPAKAYEGNLAEVASLLHLKKEEVADITADFSFEIQEITRYKEPEMDQELFNNVLGEGVATTQEQFKAKIKENLQAQFTPESDFKFLIDAQEMIKAKLADLPLPEAFLKRWLLATDQKRTEASLEQDMAKILEDLKWQLTKEKIAKENNLKLEEDDFLTVAKAATKAQFAQYGMMNIPDDLLENYAKDMLKKKETVQALAERAIETKVAQWIKSQVKIKEHNVSVEEFNKLFEAK